mmetsp:Transcript_106556/g.308828  ORF Transcript_106556/g.308828 Transcript_106556/m.308828 type:complete len:112 (-) Transcript_106556:626-961(-)
MKFIAIVTALIALVAPAAAFVPTGGARTRGLTTIKMGYVPDGLTPAQYKALKAKEEAQAKANKKKAMKGSVEDLTTWQARSAKKFPVRVCRLSRHQCRSSTNPTPDQKSIT